MTGSGGGAPAPLFPQAQARFLSPRASREVSALLFQMPSALCPGALGLCCAEERLRGTGSPASPRWAAPSVSGACYAAFRFSVSLSFCGFLRM